MKKKTLGIVLILAMALTLIAPANVFAAKKIKTEEYQATSSGDELNTRGEKVGDYYIWSSETSKKMYIKYSTTKSGKGKSLVTLNKNNNYMNHKIVTNGNTVYFSSTDEKGTTTFYRTSISSKKVKKLFTKKHVISITAYYNNNVYYTLWDGEYDNTYVYNLKTKKTKSYLKKKEITSFYGKYAVYVSDMGSPNDRVINLATKKTNALPKCYQSYITKNKVYFFKFSGSDPRSLTLKVSSCTYKGKSVKAIKTIKKCLPQIYTGKKVVLFKYAKSPSKHYSLNYSTKKITKIK